MIVVEVMGRYAGWIALHSGVAAGAHAVLIPEIQFDLEPVAATIQQREERGAKFSIVVVAEGARPKGGEVSVLGKAVGQAEKLGGIGQKVADGLSELTGKESRVVVLGHLIRGGSPTAYDRLLGLRFGAAAIRALEEGHNGIMVALNPPTVDYVPLAAVTSRQKLCRSTATRCSPPATWGSTSATRCLTIPTRSGRPSAADGGVVRRRLAGTVTRWPVTASASSTAFLETIPSAP